MTKTTPPIRLDLPETLRKRRGHRFYEIPAETPGLYETEHIATADKIVYLKLFSAAGDWWITEVERETGMAFGFVRLSAFPDGAEWGNVYLPELEEVMVHGGLVIVERDKFWTPKPVREIPDIASAWSH